MCKFQRDDGQGPLLQLQLRPRPSTIHAVQDVVLRAGSRQAELRATANLTVKPRDGVRNKELILVEWDMQLPPPQMTVLSVISSSGPAVRRWSQAGPRVQVWLERATDSVKLELTARLTPPPGKEGILELPGLRVASAQTQQTTLRLSAGSGLTLTAVPNALRNLTPSVRPDERDSVFVAAQPNYGGTWTVRQAVCEASAKVLTVVEDSIQHRRLRG